MGLYPSAVAENNSPSTPYNGPNVSQYGWTEQETGYYVQLLDYVEQCKEILKECEDIKNDIDNEVDKVEDIYQELLALMEQLEIMIADFQEDYADFLVKYNDFLAKFNHFMSLYEDMINLYEATVQAAAEAAASAEAALMSAEASAVSAFEAASSAIDAEASADFAFIQAERAEGYAEILEHPYEDMGTHTIIQGYPNIPAFSSMWYITDGGADPNDPSIIWQPGDILLYSKRANRWSRMNGESLGEGEPVPIEILDDLIMQQGKKIRFKIDDFTDHTGMSLDGDGDLVIGELPEGINQVAPIEKIGLASRELYHLYGTEADGTALMYKIYSEGYKPSPTDIGAVKRNGDTMTGPLIAPKVKVIAAPTANDDLANKQYVDLVAGTGTYFGEFPPAGAPEGTMWYCTGNGLTYLLYNDGNSTQWIENNPNYPNAVGDHEHDNYVALDGSTPMTGELQLNCQNVVVIGTASGNAARGTTFENNDGTINGGYGWEWNGTDKTNGGFHVGPYNAGYHGSDGYFRAKAGGLLYANGANRIYHQGFKPTATDVGAVSKAGDTMTGSLKVVDNINIEGTNAVATFTAMGSGQVMNIMNAGGIFAIEHPTVCYPLLYEQGSNLTKIHNPTASTLQGSAPDSLTRKDYVDGTFVSKSGDQMTGPLTNTTAGNAIGLIGGNVRSNTNQVMSLDGSAYSFVTSPLDTHLCSNTYWDGNSWLKYDTTKVSNYLVLNNIDRGRVRLFSSSASSTSPQELSYDLYHTGFKPTAADVGALPITGGTLTGNLNAPAVQTGVVSANYNGTPIILDHGNGNMSISAPGGAASGIYIGYDTGLGPQAVHAQGLVQAPDFYVTSDRRLKDNFEPIEGALDKVVSLVGQTYDKNGKREAGLIAQDLQEVLPEAVYADEEGMLGISSSGTIALLVEAVKELTAKVEALEHELSTR